MSSAAAFFSEDRGYTRGRSRKLDKGGVENSGRASIPKAKPIYSVRESRTIFNRRFCVFLACDRIENHG
jgi:hypothetical protein